MIVADAVLETLQREHEDLLRRNAELERRNAELERRNAELEERLRDVDASGRENRSGALGMYEALFEHIPVPIIIFRVDGTLVALNRASEALLRVEREAVIGRYNVFEDPESAAKGIAACFARAAAGEIMSMPPVPYDTANAGFARHEDQVLWTSSIYLPMEVGGERYVVGVHVDVTEQRLIEQRMREREDLLQTVVDNAPMLIFAKDMEGRYTLASRRAAKATGLPADAIVGKSDFELFPREMAEAFVAKDRELLAAQQPLNYEDFLIEEGERVDLFTFKFPLVNSEGRVYGICGISVDVSERRKAQEEYGRLQEEMLRVKEVSLRALSTPLIPIARGVLVMPLIGDIDQARARQVLETLLQGVARNRARVAILDVTGVQSAGSDVADGLAQVAQAVRLLGAQVVLTGVQPAMAQVLTNMDSDLTGVITRGTLEDGIVYAMRVRNR